jgi:hypothetical protein
VGNTNHKPSVTKQVRWLTEPAGARLPEQSRAYVTGDRQTCMNSRCLRTRKPKRLSRNSENHQITCAMPHYLSHHFVSCQPGSLYWKNCINIGIYIISPIRTISITIFMSQLDESKWDTPSKKSQAQVVLRLYLHEFRGSHPRLSLRTTVY